MYYWSYADTNKRTISKGFRVTGNPSECEFYANEYETEFTRNRQKILFTANSHNSDFQLTRVGYERNEKQ